MPIPISNVTVSGIVEVVPSRAESLSPGLACLLTFALTAPAWAQARSPNPAFSDYPVAETFSGQPAPPKLTRSEDRKFATKIREGVAKGPNFAGHFTIVEWGSGAGAISMALVDANDGKTYSGPFSILSQGSSIQRYEDKVTATDMDFRPLDYRLDSKLLIVRGCPEEKDCKSYFYEWSAPKFKLIRTVRSVAVP
jgi:hypothetical protein